jgi:phenylacetate-coenzyme A ligase PaaK-like adenylate-forming protein
MLGKLRISPQRIFVGGDKLTQAMERQIDRAWAAPLFDFYSASESKYIAYRQSGQDEMSVIDELNILEILDEAERPSVLTRRPSGADQSLSTLPVIRYGRCPPPGAASLLRR